MTTTGIVLFEGVEELDVTGPWEVFALGRMLRAEDRVVSIAPTLEPVRCAQGLRMLPDHSFADAPALDVLLIPGGQGTRTLMKNEAVLAWVRQRAQQATWVTSVCSGSLVLAAAGLLDGKRATTHWAVLPELKAFPKVEVVKKLRYVRDGKIVTSAGVSAGIDMSLWLFGQIASPEAARQVQSGMQYDPAPPYQADV